MIKTLKKLSAIQMVQSCRLVKYDLNSELFCLAFICSFTGHDLNDGRYSYVGDMIILFAWELHSRFSPIHTFHTDHSAASRVVCFLRHKERTLFYQFSLCIQ